MLALSLQGAGTNLLTLSSVSVPLAAGTTAPVTVTLSGSLPAPGLYSGTLVVSGAGAVLHVPYLYLVGTGSVDHLIRLRFGGFICSPQETVNLTLRAADVNGVVVAGQQVTFSTTGSGSIAPQISTTNQFG